MAQGSKQRGRIFIYIALLLILGVAAVYLLVLRPRTQGQKAAVATPAPAEEMANIVVSIQPIPYGTALTADVLTTVPYPKKLLVPGVFYNTVDELIGKRAKMDLEAKVPITSSLISDSAEGSLASFQIPDGMVAVSIPIISPLSSVGYGAQPGDHVNVIATMMFVDMDSNFQTRLPNITAGVVPPPGSPENPSLVAFTKALGLDAVQGRAEQDQTLAQPVYLVPSEPQRPRIVSQTILQDVIVLHVGEFPLTQPSVAAQTAVTPTPAPGNQQPAPAEPKKPLMISLVVTPQDAVTLNYLMYSGVEMNLALRGAGDEQRIKTDAVTLQYTMDTYSIPLPAKQPYGFEPVVTTLNLPNVNTGVAPTPK
jgi:Flp pilus assembly protein CpaB